MLSRVHRFHGHNALRMVYRNGQGARSTYFVLRYLPNVRRRNYRAAVVVSRKVHKSAVFRNRVRRRLYEALRRCESAIREPYDLVFVVLSDQLEKLSAAELDAEVQRLLRKTGVITKGAHDIVDGKEGTKSR